MPGGPARAEKLQVCHWSAHPKSVGSLTDTKAEHPLPQTSRAQATNTTIPPGSAAQATLIPLKRAGSGQKRHSGLHVASADGNDGA